MKTFVLFLSTMVLSGTTDLSDFIEGNNKFSKAFYAAVKGQKFHNGSAFTTGPFSIELLMALLKSGAKGTTAEEIKTGIFLPEDTDEAIQQALSTLPLNIATKIFASPAAAFTDDFANIASTIYQTPIEDIDFADPQQAASTIDTWAVAHNGTGSVSYIDLDGDVESVLINAIYTNINWANPFPEDGWFSGNYTCYGGDDDHMVITDLVMMSQGPALYNYYNSEELEAQFLEVPLDNPNFTLTMVVPNAWNGLLKLEQQLDRIFATPDYAPELVQLTLPMVGLGLIRGLSLVGPMTSFGIETAFTSAADFSAMANGTGDIMIRDVIHGSSIDFSDTGLEIQTSATITTKWSTPQNFEKSRDVTARKYFSDFKGVESKHSRPASESSATHEVLADHPFFCYIKYNGILVLAARHIFGF